jgi:hypothetical protein
VHVYGMCIVPITKTAIKKAMWLIFLKKCETSTIEVQKKSPVSKVSSGESIKKLQRPRRLGLHQRNQRGLYTSLNCFCSVTANLTEAWSASRYFVYFLWIMGPIFCSKISKSLFVILANCLNHEPFSICNSRRRDCPCWTPPLKKLRVQNVSHIVAVSCVWLQIYIPHTFQLQLHSTTRFDCTRVVGVDTKHCTRSVRGQSAYTVCRTCTQTVRGRCT